MKKGIKKIVVIVSICFLIAFYGILEISSSLPKFIKDRSAVKINLNSHPFNFSVDINDYSLYVNSKVLYNIKDTSVKFKNSIQQKVYNGGTGILDKSSQVFKSIEEKINDTLHNKVR